MSKSQTSIQIIDLNSDSLKLPQKVLTACENIGFMYLKNPTISAELIDQMFEQSRYFFNLPLSVKNQVAWSHEQSNQGYVGIERERLDEKQPGDLKEAFNFIFKPESELNLGFAEAKVFQETTQKFYQACSAVATTVCQLFAQALNLPESFFTDRHSQQNYTLRLLHYPPLKNTPKFGQMRAGAHSDYGSFTLLFQDNIGGLEVQTLEGNWLKVPHQPHTILVNTGDLIERWTNQKFRSTRHRVSIPTDEKKERSRYSIAFFCHPNDEVLISCLDNCQSPENPPQFEPILAGEYLLNRLRATY